MKDEDRKAAMEKICEDIISGVRETTPYFKSLVEKYPNNKPFESELIADVVRLMHSGK